MTNENSTETPKLTDLTDDAKTRKHPKDPLHGLSLKTIVTELEAHYGWEGLADRISINCFKEDPSIKSTLTFLRKTPWARTKVEALYIKSSGTWGKYQQKG